MPERVERFGYDLDSTITSNESDVVMIDVGSGRSKMLLKSRKLKPIQIVGSGVPRARPQTRKWQKADGDALGSKECSPQPLL